MRGPFGAPDGPFDCRFDHPPNPHTWQREIWCVCLVLCLVLFSAAGTMCVPFQWRLNPGPMERAQSSWHGSSASSLGRFCTGGSLFRVQSSSGRSIPGLLIGLSEFRQIWRLSSLSWTRLFLPVGLLGAGVFLLIWSDHEAWPIGSLTFTQTFFGQIRRSCSTKHSGCCHWGWVPSNCSGGLDVSKVAGGPCRFRLSR